MTLAFPPVDAGFLAWVGLAPLVYALSIAPRPRAAFGMGYLFGCVHWGWTIIWIGTTVTNWTHSPVGWVAWVLLTLVKSLWFGLFGFVAWWIMRRSRGPRQVIALAAAWVVVEWCRTQTGIAMPWALIGYTQYRYLPLVQIADVGGVYAVTFAMALVGAGVAERFVARGGEGERGRRGEWSGLVPGLLYAALVFAYGFVSLGRAYGGTPVTVALMQPNIGTQRDEKPVTQQELDARLAQQLLKYRRLAERAAPRRPLLMVWPESTVDALSAEGVKQTFAEIARTTGAYQVVGTGHEDEQGNVYNSAALFAPDGRLADRYDKTWLVPMGEWVPLRQFLPFESIFHFPRDVTPGKGDYLISAAPARASVLICYETVFPIVPRSRAAKGANLMLSITNDSWAGESAELQQHLAMTAFRAVETRRYLGASSTTGITAMIEPTGRMAAIPPYRENVLVAQAKLRDGKTLYVRFGDWFVLVCGLWVLGALRFSNTASPSSTARRDER